ncbi:MAG: trimeric intracellular cation channel family protein [Planctomycetaceae bacterium]
MATIIEFLAVVSGAVFGVLLARRKQMDIVGVFAVAFMTAFGGGTLRDLLLDRHPLFWIQHPHYPIIVFCVAGIASLVPRIPDWFTRFLDIPDAFGLALFSVVGTSYAIQSDVAPFVAVLFGVMTGTFGGVIGDIVCNEVPSLFRPSTPLYATCAFVGGWTLILLRWGHFHDDICLWGSTSVVVLMRLIALRYNVCLKPVA